MPSASRCHKRGSRSSLMNSMDKCELNAATWIIIQHYYITHRHKQNQSKKLKIQIYCVPLILPANSFYLVISRLCDHVSVRISCLQHDRYSILGKTVTSSNSVVSYKGPEKMLSSSCLWSHVMTSCRSHSCHSFAAFSSVSSYLDHVPGDA